MNRFLTASAESYPKDLNNRLIHPLSEVDCKIIYEIAGVLGDCNFNEIKAILDQYKYLKDSEVYDQIVEYRKKIIVKKTEVAKNSPSDVLESLFPTNFIMFKGLRMKLSHIHTWEKRDEFDFIKESMQYFIIINKVSESTTGSMPLNSNKIVKYSNVNKRDEDFDLLDNYMRNFEGHRFINDDNE